MAGIGTHVIKYEYTAPNGCSNKKWKQYEQHQTMAVLGDTHDLDGRLHHARPLP